MRILVFGGTGLVGHYFVRQATATGHEVVIATRRSDSPPMPKVSYLKIDLNQKGFEEQIETSSFDALVYMAYANSGPEGEQYQVTTEAVKCLLHHFKSSSLKSFIFIGSMSVYGLDINYKILNELSPKNADTFYARNKLEATQAVLNCQAPFQCTVLHPTGVYSSTSERIQGYQKLLANHYIDFLNGAQGINNIVHASDVAQATCLCLDRSGPKNEEFIINGEALRFKDWMQIIEDTIEDKKTKLPPFLKYFIRGPVRKLINKTSFRVPLKTPKYKLELYERNVYFDSSKLRQALDWKPQYKFNPDLIIRHPDLN